MLGEFLTRLAVALPLISALAAIFLLAVKRGWIALPGARTGRGLSLRLPAMPSRTPAQSGFRVLSVQAVAPSARVAVLHFHGREHLLAVNGQSLLLIASEDIAAAPHPRPQDTGADATECATWNG